MSRNDASKNQIKIHSHRHISSAPLIVDSGASTHMRGNATELVDIKEQVGSLIETSNGQLLSSNATGKFFQNRTIEGVQLVPGLQFNLLSTVAAKNLGFKVLMEGDTCRLEKNGQILLKATKNPVISIPLDSSIDKTTISLHY